jgi:hypothetical protein
MLVQPPIPVEAPQPPEHETKLALVNIIMAIHTAIKEESRTLAGEWAEQAGYSEPNAFMQDQAEAILAQSLAGFIERMQPRASQFTDAHASAYLGIPPTNSTNKAKGN